MKLFFLKYKSNPWLSLFSGMFMLITFSFSWASGGDNLMDLIMDKIKPETYKAIKSENGVIAIVKVNSAEVRREGTRSEMVSYNIIIENKIYGETHNFDSIARYGGANLTVGERYLVFLTDSRLFRPSLFIEEFVSLDCDDCGEIIALCKENIERF